MKQNDLNFYISKLYELFKDISEPGGGKGFRYWHGLRVMNYAKGFLKRYRSDFRKFNIDAEVTIISSLFHDVGKIKATDATKIINYDSQANLNHQEIGGYIIKEILREKLPIEKIEKIVEVIKEQDAPKNMMPESMLVSDCDILDNCGLLKLWRTITYAQYQGRNIDRVWEYWKKEQGLKKIEREIKGIHFLVIKKVAVQRLKKLDYVIKEMKKEAQGEDF